MMLRRLGHGQSHDTSDEMRRGSIHFDVQGDKLTLSGAFPRIERVAQTDGKSRRAWHLEDSVLDSCRVEYHSRDRWYGRRLVLREVQS